MIRSEYLWKFLFFTTGIEMGFLENRENFTNGIVMSKVLQFRGTLNLRVTPLDLPLLLQTERSISQTICELKEVVSLQAEYTFLWKSINLRQKSLSSQRRLNSAVAVERAALSTAFLESVAHVCNRTERFIPLTINIYSSKISKCLLEFLPRLKLWVSFEVSL